MRPRSAAAWSKQDWLDWERENDITERTVARCSGCGRGFIWIHHDGVACLACVSPVYALGGDDAGVRTWVSLSC